LSSTLQKIQCSMKQKILCFDCVLWL
jgi:hypothetical protein